MSEQPLEAGSAIEQPVSPEQKEISLPTETRTEVSPVIEKSAPITASASVPVADVRPIKDPRMLEIEGIMASDLDDVYLTMPVEYRQRFRVVGEQTAESIRQLLDTGKASWQKVRQLVLKWLQMIPGVNKFFLEKEAKLKADRLMNLH